MANNLIVPQDISEKDVRRRTEEERERDRVLIARLYVRGKSQHEIALTLNEMYPARPLSAYAIHSDIKAIQDAWRQSAIFDFNEAKMRELARLDEAEREAWDAWERSKQKHTRTEVERKDYQVPFSAEKIADVHATTRKKVTNQVVGEYRYLEMVQNIIKMRCDILGLFEPQRLQIDWRAEAVQAGMDMDTIEAVREKTIETLLEAIDQAAKDSGAIKEADIIDAEVVSDDE